MTQVFPTRMRTFGLGVNNAMSRIGALVSPFLAVDMVERGAPGIAEGTLALACLAAAAACAALPLETSGKALVVGDSPVSQLESSRRCMLVGDSKQWVKYLFITRARIAGDLREGAQAG